ncbi:MAG: translocation/assembly module TamB domain-containing protein [Candidatus Cryptobacteroides sp.]
MRKKKTRIIITRILEAIVLLSGIVLLLLQSPGVQTKLTQNAISLAEKHIDAKIEFSRIKFAPFTTLIIKDLAIIDKNPQSSLDTVLSAQHISATFTLKGLLAKKGGVHLDRLRAEGVCLNLAIYDSTKFKYDNNISAIFKITEKSDEHKEIPDLFSIKRADIKNFRFRMLNLNEDSYEYPGKGINWFDLDLTADVRGHDINFVDSHCSFFVDRGIVSEKSGYSFSLKGECVTGMGLTDVRNTQIRDANSSVYLKRFTMYAEKNSDFKDFVHKVILSLDATAEPLAIETISHFCGLLSDCPLLLDIEKLKFQGTINDPEISQAIFRERLSGVDADLSLKMKNTLDLQNAELRLLSNRLDLTPEGIGTFVSAFMEDKNLDLSGIAPGLEAGLTGSIQGPMNGLQADLALKSNMGDILLQAKLSDLVDSDKALSFEGDLAVNGADLDKIGISEALGRTSLNLKASGILHEGNPYIKIEQLNVNELTFNNYTYSRIDGNGYFKDKTFTGNLRCNDPNLTLIFGGSFSLSNSSSNSIYRFNMNLAYADLKKLNIDTRGGNSKLSALINIDLRSTNGHVLIGNAAIPSIIYTDDQGKHNIGEIKFTSVLEQDKIRLNLKSSFADLAYTGDPDLSTIIRPIMACSIARALPSVFASDCPEWNHRTFDAVAIIKDTKEVLSFLHQDIRIADGTRLSASLKNDSSFSLDFDSAGAQIDGYFLKNLKAKLISDEHSLRAEMGIEDLIINNFSTKNSSLKIQASGDKASLAFSTEKILGKELSTELGLEAFCSRDADDKLQVDASLGDSFIHIADQSWAFSQPRISWEDERLSFNNFSLSNGAQKIELKGDISGEVPSELALIINNLELQTANAMLDAEMPLSGILEGRISLMTPSRSNAGLNVELDCPELKLGKANAGRISLNAFLDDEDDLIKFTLTNGTEENNKLIKAEGSFNSISSYLNAKLSFNAFDPAVLQPALSGFLSELSGKIDGKISATGPVNKLAIRSNALTLSDIKLGLKPTGVLYEVDGKLRFDADGLLVEKIDIKDPKQGSAELSGRFPMLNLNLQNFSVLDKKSGGDNFYGNLALNGNIRLKGEDLSKLLLEADLANSGVGKVYITLDGGNDNSSSLLSFKEAVSEEIKEEGFSQKETIPVPSSQFEAKCRLEVNSGLLITANLDKEGSNSLNIAGDGVITADFDSRNSDISLGGNYDITSGKYHFSALSSLISKDFSIEDGSSLTFSGDVMDTELNISATHSLKASLSSLISDTTSVSTRRLVNCGIKITDKIRSPQLSFSIDIPDLDPTTKSLVDSELNTEDKISRQFLSLVVLGGFMPGSQSGINNNSSNSNFLLSNLSSIMSGQLNAVLQKMGIPLDFGLSYQQNEMGNDVMDLAVSTQLWDNMVSVNGSVGNRKFSSSSDENMVGDLDITIKLNKSGHFRLNLFSHSADDYTNYLDNSQRNGAGISYQKEYDTFRDFFRQLFRKEDKEKEIIPNKTIKITNER